MDNMIRLVYNVVFTENPTLGTIKPTVKLFGFWSTDTTNDDGTVTTTSYHFTDSGYGGAGITKIKIDGVVYTKDTMPVQSFNAYKFETEGLHTVEVDYTELTSTAHMFRGCNALVSCDLTHCYIDDKFSLYYMFENCTNLITAGDTSSDIVDFSMFELTSTSANRAFFGCRKITEVNLDGCHITSLGGSLAFGDCVSLKKISHKNGTIGYLPSSSAVTINSTNNFTSAIYYSTGMSTHWLYNSISVEEIDFENSIIPGQLTGVNTFPLVGTFGVFSNNGVQITPKLKKINLKNCDFSRIKIAMGLFIGGSYLTSIGPGAQYDVNIENVKFGNLIAAPAWFLSTNMKKIHLGDVILGPLNTYPVNALLSPNLFGINGFCYTNDTPFFTQITTIKPVRNITLEEFSINLTDSALNYGTGASQLSTSCFFVKNIACSKITIKGDLSALSDHPQLNNFIQFSSDVDGTFYYTHESTFDLLNINNIIPGNWTCVRI